MRRVFGTARDVRADDRRDSVRVQERQVTLDLCTARPAAEGFQPGGDSYEIELLVEVAPDFRQEVRVEFRWRIVPARVDRDVTWTYRIVPLPHPQQKVDVMQAVQVMAEQIGPDDPVSQPHEIPDRLHRVV